MKKWYVVNTKPKNEDRAAINLSSGGIETLAPKLRLRKYKDNRFVNVIEQMFPGYIFARFDAIDDFHLVKYTRGVKTIVHFGDRIVPIHEDLIEFIKSRLENGIATIQKKPISKGDKIIVKDGPLKGLTGIFARDMDGKERVAILLDAVQFAAPMEIDRDLI
ncbi:MAG: transcriptional activator RfaH, partial [Syntrophorhabdaceae bacterium]|nr:transcriptional activator RfaH [Syntrophorhabdaceae bacterium]